MKSEDTRKCAVCRKPVVEAHKPFCSTRCANVDLQRWFSGAYAVPVEEDDEAADPGARDPDA